MNKKTSRLPPSIDEWLKEAKAAPEALEQGMFLIHNGVVRQTPRAMVREGVDDGSLVKGMIFGYDGARVDEAVAETYQMDGKIGRASCRERV